MDLSNYSLIELQKLFVDIHTELKAPFPPGTLKYKNNHEASSYIPYQVYIHRLNSVAGGFWKWRVTTEKPIYHEEIDAIEMRGILTIVNSEVEGQGFFNLERNTVNNKIKNYDEAIKSAVKNAFSNACNYYELGWSDLKRKWSSNPGVGIVEPSSQSERICVKCKQNLSTLDEELLTLTKWKQPYCVKDLPDHVKRDLSKEVKEYFRIS